MISSKDRITSRINPRVKELVRLKDSPSKDRFLIEGKHLCDMAFHAGALLEVFSVEEADYGSVPVTLVSRDVLEKLSFSPSPSGLVGLAKHNPKTVSAQKVLLLDRVQDPGNVGTLMRTALSFGYEAVYFTKGSASPFGYKAIAGSQGAVFSLNVFPNLDALEAAASLKEKGYRLIGSALKGALPLKEVEAEKPFALILGNEGQGVDPKLLALSDTVVKIEMDGIDSLNVGVAGGILMYEL